MFTIYVVTITSRERMLYVAGLIREARNEGTDSVGKAVA